MSRLTHSTSGSDEQPDFRLTLECVFVSLVCTRCHRIARARAHHASLEWVPQWVVLEAHPRGVLDSLDGWM